MTEDVAYKALQMSEPQAAVTSLLMRERKICMKEAIFAMKPLVQSADGVSVLGANSTRWFRHG